MASRPTESVQGSHTAHSISSNADFTDDDLQALATHFALVPNHPQRCCHHCFWVDDHTTCNKLVLGHEFNEHLRTHHFTAGTDHALAKCGWAGCSSEVRKENLMRHVQEMHLEWKYTCPDCSERFTRNYTRDQHVVRRHTHN